MTQQCIWSANKIRDTLAELKNELGLKYKGVGKFVALHAEQEALKHLWRGRLRCVSFIRGITATSLICWSPTATGCPARVAWHAKSDSPVRGTTKLSHRICGFCVFFHVQNSLAWRFLHRKLGLRLTKIGIIVKVNTAGTKTVFFLNMLTF